MKILAKSALLSGQPEARKNLGADGIEIIFLGGELEQYDQTKDQLLRLADDFEVIGLEAPCDERGLIINPISENSALSRDYLSACIQLANEIQRSSRREVYFQYQYSFDNFDSQGKPVHDYDLKELRQQITEFHQGLQRQSDVQVQIENGTPIGIRRGKPAYLPITTCCEDLNQAFIPFALDLAHLAITYNTLAKAEERNGSVYRIPTPKGALWVPLTEMEKELGQRIREAPSLQDAVTSEVISQIRKYAPRIGSLQFSNARPGVGTDEADEGYAGPDGLLDVPRAFREAIIPANIPLVIPEYTELDYLNPVNQKAAIEMVRRLMNQTPST